MREEGGGSRDAHRFLQQTRRHPCLCVAGPIRRRCRLLRWIGRGCTSKCCSMQQQQKCRTHAVNCSDLLRKRDDSVMQMRRRTTCEPPPSGYPATHCVPLTITSTPGLHSPLNTYETAPPQRSSAAAISRRRVTVARNPQHNSRPKILNLRVPTPRNASTCRCRRRSARGVTTTRTLLHQVPM